MRNREVLLAVLGGIAAGALIGVLVNNSNKPKVIENTEDYFGGLKDKYGDMLDRLNKKLDALKDEFDGVESPRMSRY
jgi:hypothetical protein